MIIGKIELDTKNLIHQMYMMNLRYINDAKCTKHEKETIFKEVCEEIKRIYPDFVFHEYSEEGVSKHI